MQRFVFHVDLDQFIAAVEILRRPELAGTPVVVGGDGDPTKRGVVSTASYEARAFGVRSGMPLRTALKKCPGAVFLAVDADRYLIASRDVMATLRSFPAVVQNAGWDEAFMEVLTDEPERLARDVQHAVLERTRLWCSIGVGDNKLRAKIASDMAKPQGVFRLTAENWHQVMDDLPPRALWGVGPVTAAPLEEADVPTVQPQRSRLGAMVRRLETEIPARARRLPVAGHWLELRGQAVLVDADAGDVRTDVHHGLDASVVVGQTEAVDRADRNR
jgi:DNA polymerase-4